MAWTLTSADFSFTFNPAPSFATEDWDREVMDFDFPYYFHHQVTDWVTTAQTLILEGKLVTGALDAGGTARSLQWWKNQMQQLMYRGNSQPQAIYSLDDGDPATEGGLPYNCFGGANLQNKYCRVTHTQWTQSGGDIFQGYRLTLTICDPTSV
jgi:hypothetical protein